MHLISVCFRKNGHKPSNTYHFPLSGFKVRNSYIHFVFHVFTFDVFELENTLLIF